MTCPKGSDVTIGLIADAIADEFDLSPDLAARLLEFDDGFVGRVFERRRTLGLVELFQECSGRLSGTCDRKVAASATREALKLIAAGKQPALAR